MAASETASGPKPAFVYMVRCAGGQLYTGWTNDPAARLRAHQSGKGAKYTRAQGALGFAYPVSYTHLTLPTILLV